MSGVKANLSFLEDVLQETAGLTPHYHIDFIANRAIANGSDIGTVADIPSLTGNLALSEEGHLITDLASSLQFPVVGVTYPMTVVVEFKRTVDSGAFADPVRVLFNASDNSAWRINASDQLRWTITAGGVSQANLGGPSTAGVINTIYKGAGRVATNSVQMAMNGILQVEDTVVTLPTNSGFVAFGLDGTSVVTYTGYIRKFSIILGAATDVQLQTLSSTF